MPLLPRPCGSERLVLVAVDLDSHYSTSAEAVDLPVGRHLDVRAAAFPAAPLPLAHDDGVACVYEVIRVRVELLKRLKPAPKKLLDAGMAVIETPPRSSVSG